MTFTATSFGVGYDYIEELTNMVETFDQHHPDNTLHYGINPVFPTLSWGDITNHKPAWLLNAYLEHGPDIVWIDADSRIRSPILPPQDGFIVGARLYERWSTGMVWLKAGALPFLERWCHIAPNFPFDELSFLQAAKDTDIWICDLGSRMTSVYGGKHGQLVTGRFNQDTSVVQWVHSRGLTGELKNWPPPEQFRRQV